MQIAQQYLRRFSAESKVWTSRSIPGKKYIVHLFQHYLGRTFVHKLSCTILQSCVHSLRSRKIPSVHAEKRLKKWQIVPLFFPVFFPIGGFRDSRYWRNCIRNLLEGYRRKSGEKEGNDKKDTREREALRWRGTSEIGSKLHIGISKLAAWHQTVKEGKLSG